MKKEDFYLYCKEAELEDYWFKATGDTKAWLTERHGNMCMIDITDVVYSKSDSIVAIRRQFPSNYDFVVSSDVKLNDLLESMVAELTV